MLTKFTLSILAIGSAWLTYKVYRLLVVTPADPTLSPPTAWQWLAAAIMLGVPPTALCASLYYLYAL